MLKQCRCTCLKHDDDGRIKCLGAYFVLACVESICIGRLDLVQDMGIEKNKEYITRLIRYVESDNSTV